ncbi:hypothetical protein OROHE_026743 [Orobanche hederae]
MAPPQGEKASAEFNDVSTPEHCISNILFIIAMQTEASPLVDKFQLAEEADSVLFVDESSRLEHWSAHDSYIWARGPYGNLGTVRLSGSNKQSKRRFPKGVPWVRYSGKYKDLNINIVCPGKDTSLGVDCVGTVSTSLLTYASVQALHPDLIINAGTCGGFKEKGASIGDVFLASGVAFHDRRIPIPVFDLYGVGSRQAFSTPILAKELNLKVGKLSTGDSLDMSPHDEAAITANDATVKDMEVRQSDASVPQEGAAVAYVADLLKVPTIFLKAVTDIVDGDKPTAEEFLQNLAAVAVALEQAATQVVDFINGKSYSEL